MNKKVCLIIPPSPFLLDERVFVSLGILKVAAVLEQQGYDVDVMDLSGVKDNLKVVSDYCSSGEVDPIFFGITSTTPQLPSAIKIAKQLSLELEVPIILGGPHVTMINAARKREESLGLKSRACKAFLELFDHFDVMISGDGEKAILQAIVAMKMGERFVDADDPKSDLFLTHSSFDSSPFPARHLVDMDTYHYSIEGVRAHSLIAQLGCPFACGFCGGRESPTFRRIRQRTTENVLQEIEHIHKTWDVNGFMFYDDELNVNRDMVNMMRGISKLADGFGVDFRLRGFLKSELFTEEQAEAMWDAGFRWLLVGFESGSERILKNINKRATREDNTRCMEIARKYGFKVKALMSMGHPGESAETVKETEDWLLSVQPDDFDLSLITTYPGSPYYDHAEHVKDDIWVYQFRGDKLFSYDIDHTKIADYYKGDPEGGYQSFVFTDHLTSKHLVLLRNELEHIVRTKLSIPFYQASPGIQYESSMGQIPGYILRKTS